MQSGDERLDRFGISAALLTPFRAGGSIDTPLFVDHAKSVLRNGVTSITVFGTTGEGASLTVSERRSGLKQLVDSGIPPEKILQTVYASALGEAKQQIQYAREFGVKRFLLVPPFYFKGCSDDGLFTWHADLLNDTPSDTKFVLYHIPQVTGVPLSPELILRLARGFRDRFIGVKDSSGDWENALKLLGLDAIPVLVGDERLLHKAIALGGAGAITGMANIYPERMLRLFETAVEDRELSADVSRIVEYPVIPTLKAILARDSDQTGWQRVRAPLEPICNETRNALGL